jgi:hypothetical protein
MEEISPIGISRNIDAIKGIITKMGYNGNINAGSVCYVSQKMGLATDNYSYSIRKKSRDSYEATASPIKPSMFTAGLTVLNQQVICFIPKNANVNISLEIKEP